MKTTALVILDGYGRPIKPKEMRSGRQDPQSGPFLLKPHTQLQASGLAVGLPEGRWATPRWGHTNMGAGRVVYQELTRIHKNP